MNTRISTPDEKICEQLSAYMDGELPEIEARFLCRRFEHDTELRAKWERLQLASACLKRQPIQLMTAGLYENIHNRLSPSVSRSHRPFFRWTIAASFIMVAVLLMPHTLRNSVPETAPVTAIAPSVKLPINSVASPASADLVATDTEVPGDRALSSSNPVIKTIAPTTPLVSADTPTSSKESPLPLAAQSPENFPLIDHGDKKTWPHSALSTSSNDPALEAYLVRHNQMLANDGFGGFFPYVDVVANDQNTISASQGSDIQRNDGNSQ